VSKVRLSPYESQNNADNRRKTVDEIQSDGMVLIPYIWYIYSTRDDLHVECDEFEESRVPSADAKGVDRRVGGNGMNKNNGRIWQYNYRQAHLHDYNSQELVTLHSKLSTSLCVNRKSLIFPLKTHRFCAQYNIIVCNTAVEYKL